jgi:DNA-binding NarL/FixJ family response regulator
VLLRNVTPAEVVVAMRAGAKGVHCLDCHLDDLPHTIRVVAAGGAGLAGCAALALATHFNGTSELMTRSLLSPQEQRILRMLAEGDANEEISMKLGIEVRTVKFHVSSILRKLGSRNRAAAVALAYRQGLVV